MNRMKDELNGLKDEESSLHEQRDVSQQQLEQLIRTLTESQAQIEQVRASCSRYRVIKT